jgi:hypothetical protein
MCKRFSTLLVVAGVAACLLLLRPFAYAQQPTGRILGVVTDQQGAVVPAVAITVTNVATGIKYKTTTDKDGAYQALNLPIGAYTVTAERQGFRKMVVSAGQLEINQNLKIDVALQVGAVSEVIEVSTGGVAVESQSATVGDSVTSRPIVDMPLNGRNVFDLARLEPGVTDNSQTADSNYSGQNFSVAGGRVDSVSYLLDGGDNNNLLDNNVVYNPNPDAIAEFRILENNYSAEYGRNAGGIVSVVTKSGTNGWHGSAFEFLRNDAMAANTFFNNYEGLPKNILKRHQFGGTFGGPIVKDKAFFFFSYEGQRLTQGMTPGLQTVFTDNELNGDFSQAGPGGGPDPNVAAFLQANPYFQSDPAKAAQAIIDPTMIDPVAKNYIAAGIVPHSASGKLDPQSTYKDNFNEYTGKFDLNLTEKDKISASLGMKRDTQLCPFAQNGCTGTDTTIPFPDNWGSNTYFLNLAYTRSFSSTLLNEVRVTAQRLNMLMAKPAETLPNNTALGVGNTPDQATGPPEIFFYNESDWLGFSYRGPTTEINNTFGLTDTVSWVKGKHSMKFGGAFSPYENNTVYDYYVNGEFDFYGATTGSGSGTDFADFLMGLPDEYYEWPKAPSNIRSKYFAAFAQDEWRITRNLVLSYGLRYEYSSPMYDTLGRSFTIVPDAQSTRFVNAPVGLLFPGDAGAPRGANYPDTKNFGPRFGFAWDPSGSGKTSVRGGFGMFYDILKGEANLQFNGQAPFFGYTDFNFYLPSGGYPVGYVAPISGEAPCPLTAQPGPNLLSYPFCTTGTPDPFPSKPPASNIDFGASGFLPFGGNGVYFVDPHMKTPYSYQYNLSIQHQIGRSLRADVSYLGSISRKLSDLIDTNPFILDQNVNRVLWTQPGASSGDWSFTPTFANVGHENYNSFQASLKKQVSDNKYFGSSYFTLGYSWSKNLDNASGFRQSSASVPYYQPNHFYALSDIDIGHSITTSGGWDLPFANLFASAPKRLTKGWSLYPIITWRDGFPIDITANLPHNRIKPGPSGAGDSQLVRVNLVGNSVTTLDPYASIRNLGGAFYFNPALAPTPGANFELGSLQALNQDWLMPTADQRTYGTLPRNSFRGPSRTNIDFSFAKATPLWNERTNLEFHADFFNILNSTQFYNPTLNPTSSLFGEITKTYDAREIQLALRLTF